ncbi:pyocin [Pseudomonas sp. MAFF 212408]|uniref:Pyocin n=1 Tax=Pseudomonas kitaguniensis TaxID=2607908 RepID=A0A5N7KN82_9PSED|nr:S-type pyocin domain-containing protein [Pseudomonas kitaguniensis]MPR03609.1 pyocin [Pseudomonas kitaguniensis]
MSGYVPKPARPNASTTSRNSGVEPVDLHALYWAQYPDLADESQTRPTPTGCVFAKSCNLPDGVINHQHPTGFVPVERLADYGMWAVLGTGTAISAQGSPLQWVAGSASGRAVANRLAGSLALTLLEGAGALAASATVGTVALLMPNATAADSAFYTQDQYATLEAGRTRVRVNVKTLPDGSVNAYGFYTGGKADWESVPVIKAKKNGEQYVADIGNGIGLTWTPAVNPQGVLGIPALEGAPPLRTVWVYPPTPQAEAALHNPQHPPEFQDAIIWFPADAGIAPIYVVLSTQLEKNKVAGAAYEEEAYGLYSKNRKYAVQQITLKTESGTKVRVDMMGRGSDGEIECIECKASETAPLTRNQKRAFPEIEESGAVIVGKGKPGFPGGTVIPPTRIKISRPKKI